MTVSLSAYRQNRIGRIKIADELLGGLALLFSQFEETARDADPINELTILTGYCEAFTPVPIGMPAPFYRVIVQQQHQTESAPTITFEQIPSPG